MPELMNTYNVTMTWAMAQTIQVQAKSPEDAKAIAEDYNLDNGEYVCDSFEIMGIELATEPSFDAAVRLGQDLYHQDRSQRPVGE